MKIWVTGANGQLGQEFRVLAENSPKFSWHFSNSSEANITDFSLMNSLFNEVKPDILINCAAYTKVDDAEKNIEKCNAVNANAAEFLALKCEALDISFIHFSSDYVFDGKAEIPYLENDKTNPLSVYGASKAEGDAKILNTNVKGIIFRSSWIYSQFGHNFLKTMLRLGAEKEKLTVINDQISCPTNAADLAKAVIKSIELKLTEKPISILNFSNSGTASWFDFASYIMKSAKLPCEINPIPTTSYPLPAERPKYSLLSISKFVDLLGYKPKYWKDAVDSCIKLINKTKNAQ